MENLLYFSVPVIALTFISIFVYFVGAYKNRSQTDEKVFNYMALMNIARVQVKRLEQEGKMIRWSGADKKQIAMINIMAYSEKFGMECDEDLAGILVEAAVHEINEGRLPEHEG